MLETAAVGKRNQSWAIVLAAGEGRRLSMLTESAGVPVPKQFCSLWGGRSLLQDALQRAQRVVQRGRICAVVAARHRQWWETPLWSLPGSNRIVQHENRGTGTGLLLGLLHVVSRDPGATVVVLPSDHYVGDEPLLADVIGRALALARRFEEHAVLIGLRPEDTCPELGYIVPAAAPDTGLSEVAEFVEKPSPVRACELVAHGALWNAFIVVATASALLRLYRRKYAHVLGTLQQAVANDCDSPETGEVTAGFYRELPTIDFSNDILRGQEASLRVLGAPPCGWADLGSPRLLGRVIRGARPTRTTRHGPWDLSTPVLAERYAEHVAGDAAAH